VRAKLLQQVSVEKVGDVLRRILHEQTSDTYQRQRAARLLIRLGDDAGTKEILDLLESSGSDLALAAAEAIIGR